MKLTSLTISPTSSWQSLGPKNPMRAVVKIEDDKSAVECVLSDETMRKLLNLCASEIADNAARNVADFVSAVTAIEGDKATAMLDGPAAEPTDEALLAEMGETA